MSDYDGSSNDDRGGGGDDNTTNDVAGDTPSGYEPTSSRGGGPGGADDGGIVPTTWGDPFPGTTAEGAASLPVDHGLVGDDAEAAKAAEKAARTDGGPSAPWVRPDAPPPPQWAAGQSAPASPPNDPGYSPYPAHPMYPGAPGGAPTGGYPSGYGAVPPSPTGFPAASAMPGRGPYVPRRRTNGFAAASLTIAIVGVFFCFAPVLSILAIVFGHVARARIARSQGAETGQRLALGGLTIGYVTLLLAVAFWAFVVLVPASPPGGDAPSSIAQFGTDPALDTLARSCHDEDFAACDRLWLQADRGSSYESYGETCGGREDPDPNQSDVLHVRCTERFDN